MESVIADLIKSRADIATLETELTTARSANAPDQGQLDHITELEAKLTEATLNDKSIIAALQDSLTKSDQTPAIPAQPEASHAEDTGNTARLKYYYYCFAIEMNG